MFIQYLLLHAGNPRYLLLINVLKFSSSHPVKSYEIVIV